MNGYTFRGSNSSISIVKILLDGRTAPGEWEHNNNNNNKNLLFKARKLYGSIGQGRKQESQVVVSLCKMAEKYGGIPKHLNTFVLKQHKKTGTLACVAPIIPRIFHWIKIAVEEDHDDMVNWNFGMLQWIGISPPAELKDTLPEIIDLMLETEKYQELQSKLKHNANMGKFVKTPNIA